MKFLCAFFLFSNAAFASMWTDCSQVSIQKEFGTSLKGKFTEPKSTDTVDDNLYSFFKVFNANPQFDILKTSKIDASENKKDGIGLVQVFCNNNQVVAYNIHMSFDLKDADQTTMDMFDKKNLKKYKTVDQKNGEYLRFLDIRESADTYFTRFNEDGEFLPVGGGFSFLYISKDFVDKSIKSSAVKAAKLKEEVEAREQASKKKVNTVLP